MSAQAAELGVRTDQFDYRLPPDRVAQEPLPRRDESRLLVLRTAPQPGLEHRTFFELPMLLAAGDLVVVNDARVLRARLEVRRPGGGRAELLLLEPTTASNDPRPQWRALVRPAKRVRVGQRLQLVARSRSLAAGGGAPGPWVQVVGTGDEGSRIIAFPAGSSVAELLDTFGEVPLPPYIHRQVGDRRTLRDRRRYQTVYAHHPGAIAAPTAGLHFTREIMHELERHQIGVATLTLDVGPGTFRPITSEHVDNHQMASERYRIPAATAQAVRQTRRRGGRVVAVGTTVVRALESSVLAADGDEIRDGEAEADLMVRPGYRFRVIDALITNFHLPRSTPLLLAAALVGRQRLLRAYEEAITYGYRFYSYGDAMLVLP